MKMAEAMWALMSVVESLPPSYWAGIKGQRSRIIGSWRASSRDVQRSFSGVCKEGQYTHLQEECMAPSNIYVRRKGYPAWRVHLLCKMITLNGAAKLYRTRFDGGFVRRMSLSLSSNNEALSPERAKTLQRRQAKLRRPPASWRSGTPAGSVCSRKLLHFHSCSEDAAAQT